MHLSIITFSIESYYLGKYFSRTLVIGRTIVIQNPNNLMPIYIEQKNGFSYFFYGFDQILSNMLILARNVASDLFSSFFLYSHPFMCTIGAGP